MLRSASPKLARRAMPLALGLTLANAAVANALSGADGESYGEQSARLAGNPAGTVVHLNADNGQFTATETRQLALTITSSAGRRVITFAAPNVLDTAVAIDGRGVITVAWSDQVGQGDTTGTYYRTYDSSGKLLRGTVRYQPPRGVRPKAATLIGLAAGGHRTVLLTSARPAGDPNALHRHSYVALRSGSGRFGGSFFLPGFDNALNGPGTGMQVLPSGVALIADDRTRLFRFASGSRTGRRLAKSVFADFAVNPLAFADDGSWAAAGGSVLFTDNGRRTSPSVPVPKDQDALIFGLPQGRGGIVYGADPQKTGFPTEIHVVTAEPAGDRASTLIDKVIVGDQVTPDNIYSGEPIDVESATDGTIAFLTKYADDVVQLTVVHPDGSVRGTQLGTEDRGFPSKAWQLVRAGGAIFVAALDEDHDDAFGTATFTPVS